jgi:hypothetical protein
MNFYIQIKDGQPFEHPIFEDNILAVSNVIQKSYESISNQRSNIWQ